MSLSVSLLDITTRDIGPDNTVSIRVLGKSGEVGPI